MAGAEVAKAAGMTIESIYRHLPSAVAKFNVSSLIQALVSTLMVANTDEAQLRSWLKIYNVETTWVVTGDGSKAPLDFWTTDVLTFIGKLNATPTVAVTAHTPTAKMLASRAIPVVRYYEPDGIMPDWGPTNSSWADKAPDSEE